MTFTCTTRTFGAGPFPLHLLPDRHHRHLRGRDLLVPQHVRADDGRNPREASILDHDHQLQPDLHSALVGDAEHRRIYDFTNFPQLAAPWMQDLRVVADSRIDRNLGAQVIFLYNFFHSLFRGEKADSGRPRRWDVRTRAARQRGAADGLPGPWTSTVSWPRRIGHRPRTSRPETNSERLMSGDRLRTRQQCARHSTAGWPFLVVSIVGDRHLRRSAGLLHYGTACGPRLVGSGGVHQHLAMRFNTLAPRRRCSPYWAYTRGGGRGTARRRRGALASTPRRAARPS